MQGNMIMLISCQRLCVEASYVNYTRGCICSGFQDRFHLMALLKSRSRLPNIWKSKRGLLYSELRQLRGVCVRVYNYFKPGLEKSSFDSKSPSPLCLLNWKLVVMGVSSQLIY